MAARIVGFIASLCALLITLYPGFVLSASRSIPFWNSPFLPLLFFAQSLMGASGILLFLSPFIAFEKGQIESVASWLIVVNILLVAVYLLAMNQSGAAAKESVRRLNQTSLGWTFRIGVALVGMIFPLLMLVWYRPAAIWAGALILTGGLLFRYCVLRAGVYVPSALVGMDLSRLNRNDANLAQEYAGTISRRP